MRRMIFLTGAAALAFGMGATAPALAQDTTAATLPQDAPDPGRELAEHYGLDDWAQVEQIRFTFHARVPGREQAIERAWLWTPKTDTIVFDPEGEEPVMFRGADAVEASDAIKERHHQFINDSYWLLFPFQLAWSNPTVTGQGEAPLPIGEGSAVKLTAQWPDEGGYTPGDAYDLYLGEGGLIVQWVFRKGGGDEGRPATWEDHARVGPIVVSLTHQNADGSFRLWFTDVAVMLEGGEAWRTPIPLADPVD